jgi:ectoine hydroxylase-related dioxygenase (phytanoyl-CoA dioxygenase family)
MRPPSYLIVGAFTLSARPTAPRERDHEAMLTVTVEDFSPEAVVEELLDGDGAIRVPGVYTADQVARAKAIVEAATADHALTGSHFNQDEAGARLQRRVWNLFAVDPVFCDMIEHHVVVDSMRALLGSDFVVGSYCASRTMPGYAGQEPHIDYPYWDYHRAHSFPARINSSFPLNAQGTIVIDPFTVEAGATAYRPRSARELRYPTADDRFFDAYEQMLGDPGDLILFYGLTWHCAMPNRSSTGRIGLLIEFLPKFVKPVEDMLTGLEEDFLACASPMIRQMLGLAYPWPSAPPHDPFV